MRRLMFVKRVIQKDFIKKARVGDVSKFMRIYSSYEAPGNPEIILGTVKFSVDECLNKLISYLEDKKIINNIL